MFSSSTYVRFLNIDLFGRNAVRKLGEGFGNGCFGFTEVRVLEISINIKQGIAIVWTLISMASSLAVVISWGILFNLGSWQLSLGFFFVLLLAMILPVYLFIALWHMMSKD
jgi:hypothetical protein